MSTVKSKLGKFIVIEGTDGSGKTEQTKRLVERLEKVGAGASEFKFREKLRPSTFDFPQYGNPSAYFVEQYLNGKYGTAEEVGPYRAALFFALDRFEASFRLRRALEENQIVVSNRYVGSNLAHQGGKIVDVAERKRFFEWDYDLEYEILGIPKPDLNIVLHIPAEMAQVLVAKKESRQYLKEGTHDLHEKDLEHLRHAEQVYLEIVNLFPKDFCLIECTEKGKLLSIEEIHERVWKKVTEYLK